MRLAGLVGGAAVIALSACVTAPTYVPLPSPRENITALGGEWRGEYTSEVTGRTGTLYLSLTPGTNAAVGELVVLPYRSPGLVNWEDRVTITSARHLAEPQKIQFVSFESGIVTARVGPYVDTNCGNVHVTTYFGEVRNGRIAGRYISRSDAHGPQTGEWSVDRVR